MLLGLLAFSYYVFFNRTPEIEEIRPPFRDGGVEIRRGSILDRFGNPLAISLVDSSIYVKPREFADIADTTEKLAKALGLNSADLLAEVKTQKSFIWLARHIPYDKARKIEELQLSGVHIVNRVKRVYPHNFKVPGIIGEVSQEEGLSGLEYYYNELLLGKDVVDEGAGDLYLTLDLKTQVLLEEKLSDLLSGLRPKKAGSGRTVVKAVVMDYKTGGIIACSQQASGAAGSVSSVSLSQQSSRFFSDYLDPGGLEVLFRKAAALRVGRQESGEGLTKRYRIIAPGKIKKDINPPPGLAWRKTGEGDLIYPWFARRINKLDLSSDSGGRVPSSLSNLELAAFSAALGFSSPVRLDLPEEEFLEPHAEEVETFMVDKGTEVLPLNFLSGFSCIMTGYRQEPHFYKMAVWENGKIARYQNKDMSGGICKDIGKKLLPRLRSDAADSVFVLESLRPRKDCQSENEENLVCADGVALALIPGGKGKDDEGLVLLFVLERGLIDLFQPSRVKPVLTEFLQTAYNNSTQQVMLSLGQIKDRKAEYLDSWLLTADGGGKPAVSSRDTEGGATMPDVVGLSLRQALRRLQHREVNISVYGSGIVIKQSPGPGEVIENNRCVLSADFDRATRKKQRIANEGQ